MYLIFKKIFKLKLKPGELISGEQKLEKLNWTLDDYGIKQNDIISTLPN